MIVSKKGHLASSTIITFAFATAFFPRILESAGAPSAVNFAHFIVVPFCCLLIIVSAKTKNRLQVQIVRRLLVGLFVLLTVVTASAVLNSAGIVNLALSFFLLGEPFLLLAAIISVPFSRESFGRFRVWILSFAGIHLATALSQWILLATGILQRKQMTVADNVQGVFYLSGAGHVVGASVSISFALYFLASEKRSPLVIRILIFLAAVYQLLLADAKQALVVWLMAWAIFILLQTRDLTKAIKYVSGATAIGLILLWCIQNLTLFRAFNTWIRPGLYGPDGLATQLKLQAFHIIPGFYKSLFNWGFGLGPGHTVSRLGGWFLKDYWGLLGPLGATTNPATAAVWDAWRDLSWLDSSFFSPLFGWAGVWGDLGFLGLAAYLYLAYLVWHYICRSDFSKFIALTVLCFGVVFTQMEEPGYMLSIACLLGLQWHEQRLSQDRKPNKLLFTIKRELTTHSRSAATK